MFDPAFAAMLGAVAEKGTTGGFLLVAYRGIFAGWLVASTRATGAQTVLVWLTTAPIAAFG